MAAERTTIELQKINEFVSQLDGLVDITSAIVYGVDADGNSVKLTVRQLTDHAAIESRLTTVETKAETNRTNIATINAALPSKSDVGHTHTISNVTNLQTALNGKAATVHKHAISDVTDLQTALNGKAATVHEHAISDVTDLQIALNGKSNSNHTHDINDVAGLQGELDNKAPLNHTHSIPEVEQLQTQIQEINSEVTDLNTDVNQITIAAGMPQVEDLTTYTAAAEKVVQYVGETTSDYKHGYIYQYNQVGDPVEVPAGYWYRNLANGHILRLTNTSFGNKQSQISSATIDGLTYYVIGGLDESFRSETEVDWDTIMQSAVVGKMLIPCSNGSYYKVSELVGETQQASNGWFWIFRSMVLDNGVEITWQDLRGNTYYIDINKIFEDPSDVGTIYYGNNYGGELCPIITKVHIDNDNSQFKLIPTEPIGYIFTGSEHYEATATTVTTMQWQQTLVQPDSRIYFDETNSKIQIKDEFGNVKSEISAAAFLKDGMIQSVELVTVQEQGVSVEVPYLKFVFNTDAGQQPIRLSLHDISAVTTGVLEQVDDMTNYTGASPNKIIQYTGISTTDYINGYMYKYKVVIPSNSMKIVTNAQMQFAADIDGVYKNVIIPSGSTFYLTGERSSARFRVMWGTYTPTGQSSYTTYACTGNTTLHENGHISVAGYEQEIVSVVSNGNNYTITTDKGVFSSTSVEMVQCSGGENEDENYYLFFPDDESDGRAFIVLKKLDNKTLSIINYQYPSIKTVTTTNEYAWKQHDSQPRDSDYSNATVEFTETSSTYSDVPTPSTELPRSGWSLKDKFAKVYKWFASLKKVCFTGSYTDLTNRPFKDFTLTEPNAVVAADTWMGLIKWSRTDLNERLDIFGGWSQGTLGMITIEVKGRPVASMGYSISYSTPAMDKSYTLAVGIKDEEVYLLFKYTNNYRSSAHIRLSGYRNDYAENLNFAIFTEYSSLTFVKSIEVSKS